MTTMRGVKAHQMKRCSMLTDEERRCRSHELRLSNRDMNLRPQSLSGVTH